MKYDYLKVKKYDFRVDDLDKNKVVLSFGNNHHIKVSKLAKQILDCFDGNNTIIEISKDLQKDGIECSENDLNHFVEQILIANNLLQENSSLQVQENDKSKKKRKLFWLKIPLIDSNKISGMLKITGKLFNSKATILICTILFTLFCYNIYEIIFTDKLSITGISTWQILLYSYISLFIHEIGHASAAYHYNTPVGKIGVGMYMFTPVCYVDLTNIWRLTNKKRAVVDIGGIYFQVLIIIPLSIAAILTKNISYNVICFSILILAIKNLVPFMKLDGYWLLSDLCKLDNLSDKAFKIIKGLLKKDTAHKYSKSFYIGAVFYVVSTIGIFILGAYSAIFTLINIEYILYIFNRLLQCFLIGDFKGGFIMLNQFIVIFIPLIYLILIAVRMIGTIVSSIRRKSRN